MSRAGAVLIARVIAGQLAQQPVRELNLYVLRHAARRQVADEVTRTIAEVERVRTSNPIARE